ncbi:MAG: tetratricopeptide repeat protein [Candidatus Hermodarchaeota archaeon]
MPDLAYDEIEQGWRLLNEGKEEDALRLIRILEKNENLTPEEKLKSQILKGTLLFFLVKIEESLNISRKVYNESLSSGKPLLSIDAIFIEWMSLFMLGRGGESWEQVKNCESLLKAAAKEPHTEIEQREGLLNFMTGYFHFWEATYDRSLEYLERSLSVFKRYKNLSYLIGLVLHLMGGEYMLKGEFELALKYIKNALEAIISDTFAFNVVKATIFHGTGEIYRQLGKLDLATEYFEKCFKFCKKHNFHVTNLFTGFASYGLIQIALDRKSPDQAQKYLDRFKQLLEEKNLTEDYFLYKLATARVLKYSSRTRNRAKAEEILKELIFEHEKTKSVGYRGVPEESILPLIELCHYYIRELRLTNAMEILDDVKPLIKRLFKESERTNSYSLLAQTYLLSGMLSLLQMNLGDARRELSQAQDIAESHGLQLLARKISHEHDKLLEQLGDWENLKLRKSSIAERINLTSLDESIALIQGKRTISPPELVNEEPVLLMILAEGGVLLFSYPFLDEWKQNSDLFGSFLSAFKSFSDEFFSEGLDRAKFGQFIILMENVANFSLCYLFKGQTYLAKKKLTNFTDSIQKNVSIMETLVKYYKTSQVLELKDFPFLEGFVKGIFVG